MHWATSRYRQKEATIAIENRVLEGQYIYKCLTLDKGLSQEQEHWLTVALRIARVAKADHHRIERAIVIGDGLVDASDDKIRRLYLSADVRGWQRVCLKHIRQNQGESRRTAILVRD